MERRRDNQYGTVAVVVALVAVIASLFTENAVVAGVGLVALTFAVLGVRHAVRVDYGMSRSLTALLLALFALVVWVFSRGGSTSV